VPEAILPLVYVIGIFFAVVGYAFARGALATWGNSVGYLLQWLATHARIDFSVLHKHVSLDLGGPFRAVDREVVSALQAWANGAEIEFGYCLHGLEQVARYTAQAIDYLARETSETFDWLVNVHIPKWVKYAAGAAFPFAWITKLIAGQIAKHLPHLRSEIHTIERTLPGKVVTIFKYASTAALPGLLGLPKIHGDITNLWKWRTKAEKRLHKVEGIAAAGVFAGLLANSLGITTRCVRSGNVGKFARRLCGLDNLIADALLADLAFVAGTISIVEFAKALQKAAPIVATSLVYVVDEIPIAVKDAEAMGQRALAVLETLA
jgi:hypothetical protein